MNPKHNWGLFHIKTFICLRHFFQNLRGVKKNTERHVAKKSPYNIISSDSTSFLSVCLFEPTHRSTKK